LVSARADQLCVGSVDGGPIVIVIVQQLERRAPFDVVWDATKERESGHGRDDVDVAVTVAFADMARKPLRPDRR
jgi:hypothetical protein